MGDDILQSERFSKAKRVPHHMHCNIATHSLETAGYALGMARMLRRLGGVDVLDRDVVRASLLHDIGMTEDEVFLSPSRKKAYSHPRESARIAREEFGANMNQVEAIRHHMWPIGLLNVPCHATDWVVMAADKYCSAREVQREIARGVHYMSEEARRRIKYQRRAR